MPNKNYIRGYKLELRAKKELEASGYYVTRSAGSKGLIDIIGIDLNHIRLIQLKRQKKATSGWRYNNDENIKKLRDLLVPANCRKELWVWTDKKGWKKDVFSDYTT